MDANKPARAKKMLGGTMGSTTRAPKVHKGTFAEAFSMAQEATEPVFVPVTAWADDRGWSYMNLLTDTLNASGQLNYSTQYPGIVKAWHAHEKQTDFWMCLSGHVKAGAYREQDGAMWALVIGEKRPGVLVIPRTLWHGAATVGPTPAGLMYYVTHAYDAAKPDEKRRAWDSVPGFNWLAQNG
jgi:dTDP-4-dehydrorhamnose 3,5-epimerase